MALSNIWGPLLTNFLVYYLRWKQQHFRSLGQTGTQANLNTGIVNGSYIGLPPISEQKRIAAILERQDDKIDCENWNLEKLQKIKKSLMHDLLTGKVRVKPNKEMV
ncbi:MAG TPA: restriction endonuclease subunit S [Gammaproteobacteria bacterium]|nr:restriction endonuclease subunit S [Gammaproteobacteria bacterium]